MTVFVFGNEYLEGDTMAKEVADVLGVAYTHCRSPEELMDNDGTITIVDVVKGIDEPVLITDTERIRTRSILSMHDFDVGYFLGLMREMGDDMTVRVIGIPQSGDPRLFAEQVKTWI